MNDVIDAINTRFKSPYFGYAVLAFFALNWRGIFLLSATEGDPASRLEAFDSVLVIAEAESLAKVAFTALLSYKNHNP